MKTIASISVATSIHDNLERRLREIEADLSLKKERQKSSAKSNPKKKRQKAAKKLSHQGAQAANLMTIVGQLDMSQRLDKRSYQKQLIELQARLHKLHLQAKEKKLSSILVFEGPDAAGKGGAIRRINEALDARNYQVHGIAAPTEEELAQHYLWRFWRHVSRGGRISIFDRSWYGRVLVERVEGFATEDEWRRSYAEINDFEEQLIEHDTVLVKYWIHITKDEQLARFKLREKTPHKRWKLTEEDWRNRDRWSDYENAVHDMGAVHQHVQRTLDAG